MSEQRGETENTFNVDEDIPLHRQLIVLLGEILHKLCDIHEELIHRPSIAIDDGAGIEGDSDSSYESPV